MRHIFTILLLAFLTIDANASSYQVEIIVFENLHQNSDEEISRTGLKLPDFTDSIILDESDTADISAFKLLPAGLYKLGGVYNELKYSKNYRPLLHMAWEQPALNQGRARSVRIRDIDNIDQTDNNDPMIKLDGVIRIRSTQFLHADVDLFYFINSLPESVIQADSGNNTAATIQTGFAELKETRKMKLNELHYFDNPVFGLLLWVSRFND